MKRMMAFVLVLLLCLSCAQAEIGDTVKVSEDGLFDIAFDNGYKGYDVDYVEHEASKDDEFIEQGTDVIIHNASGEKVGNLLKTFFVDFYDLAMEDKIKTQHIIWHFTDNYTGWRIDPEKVDEIRAAASQKTVPDHGAVKPIDDETELVFDFIGLEAEREGYADFFGYKVTERKIPVITSPAADVTVTVNEYENTQMKIEARNAESYLWQLDRGSGWQSMPYAATDTLPYSRAALAHDGFKFRCAVSNQGKTVYSPVFTLKVIPYVPPTDGELPQTGDAAPLALCAALLPLAAVTFLQLKKKTKKLRT